MGRLPRKFPFQKNDHFLELGARAIPTEVVEKFSKARFSTYRYDNAPQRMLTGYVKG